MPDTTQLPAIVAVPDVTANDGHEHFWSPRNIIAFLVLAIFAFSVAAPYMVAFPKEVQAVNMILSGSKTAENIMILVLGFYFGTTVNAQRQQETIRQQALAAPGTGDGLQIKVDPPATLQLKESPDASDANAGRRVDEAPAAAAEPRVQPRDDGPPE